jgi:hypothetical protein
LLLWSKATADIVLKAVNINAGFLSQTDLELIKLFLKPDFEIFLRG